MARVCLLVCGLAVAVSAARAGPRSGGLPPPPDGMPGMEDATMHLELVVNGRASGTIAPVRWEKGVPGVAARFLRQAGIRIAGEDGAVLHPDAGGEFRAALSDDGLQLLLTVPSAWLPVQRIAGRTGGGYVAARSGSGMVLNYDGYASRSPDGGTTRSLWHELRWFGAAGVIASTGIWHAGGGDGGSGGYLRYDTQWRRSDPQRMLTYEVGDLVTRGVAWSRPVRLGGVQVSRDFSIRPDILTYPLPVFAGEASLPSAVELIVDGQRAMGRRVDPGPFLLDAVPGINGAGLATVVTTDALGRQVAASIPFYVSTELLAPGMAEFAVSAGALRRRHGRHGHDYGSAAATASLRYGVADWLTLEAHGEGGRDGLLAGSGVVARLGRRGVVDAAVSASRWEGRDGTQAGAGYQYSARGFGVRVSHRWRSAGHADLSTLDRAHPPGRYETVASLTVPMRGTGTAGLGYVDASGRDGRRARLFNASWSQSLPAHASLFLSVNRSLEGGGWAGAIQYLLPLDGGRGSLGTVLEASGDGRHGLRLHYRQAAPSDGGSGWGLGYARTRAGDDYWQADAIGRNRGLQWHVGINGEAARLSSWAMASGSLVLMEGRLFASQRINDAFALVDASGQGGIPVLYENQPVGVTDDRGYLLVPWASAWHPASYAIDTLDLPHTLHAEQVEQRVAIVRGSGHRIRFPIRAYVPLQVVLHDGAGRPLSPGAAVSTAQGRRTVVGWDGLLYLEDPLPRETLDVRLPDGTACRTELVLPDPVPATPVGPLECR